MGDKSNRLEPIWKLSEVTGVIHYSTSNPDVRLAHLFQPMLTLADHLNHREIRDLGLAERITCVGISRKVGEWGTGALSRGSRRGSPCCSHCNYTLIKGIRR